MKAEELMIGDWVMLDGKNEQITGIYVHSCKHGYVQIKNIDCSAEYLEPIPLTPEILEKNGFESTENIFGLKTYKLNDDFILEDRGEEKCLCRNCYKMQPSPTFWVCNIEHVHELQHALRLCGITKTIEL